MAEHQEQRFDEARDRAGDRLHSPIRSSTCPSSRATPAAAGPAGVSSPVRGNSNAEENAAAFREQEQREACALFPSSHPLSPCRPWDRREFFKRLATFRSMTWFRKPRVAGPLACARRGWINVGFDIVSCQECGSRLHFVLGPPPPLSGAQVDKQADMLGEIFAEQLDLGHSVICGWKGNVCSEAFADFPPTPTATLVNDFNQRCEGLLQVSALPTIRDSAIDTFKLLRGPEIECLLGQPPPPPPIGFGFHYVNEQQATDAEPHERSEIRSSFEEFFQAQRLIALCGWELVLLPFTVENVKAGGISSKISQSADLCDAIASSKCRDLRRIVLYGVKEEKGKNPVTEQTKEKTHDPSSAVLNCKFCGARGLCFFPTIPEPPVRVLTYRARCYLKKVFQGAGVDLEVKGPQRKRKKTTGDAGGPSVETTIDVQELLSVKSWWDTPTGKFDPINQHRDFCPWVNAQCGASESSGSSSSHARVCGWQLTIDALYTYYQQDGGGVAEWESNVSV